MQIAGLGRSNLLSILTIVFALDFTEIILVCMKLIHVVLNYEQYFSYTFTVYTVFYVKMILLCSEPCSNKLVERDNYKTTVENYLQLSYVSSRILRASNQLAVLTCYHLKKAFSTRRRLKSLWKMTIMAL